MGMKIIALTSFIICLVCVLSFSMESTEENLVEGNFSKSCKGMKFSKNTLTALCKNKKGKFGKKTTSVSLTGCLANINGALKPGKNFHKSSKACKVVKNVLNCSSKNKKGKYVKSHIKLDSFISNINGSLKCDKAKKAAKGKGKKAAKGKGKKKF